MGLPNYKTRPDSSPSTGRKPAGKARQPQEKCRARRTLDEVDRACRAGTDYAKQVGYLAVPHAFLADLSRLTSGNVCTMMCLLALQDLSRQAPRPMSYPTETGAMSVLDLATLIRCDERSVNRVLEYLETRGMATLARLADSKFVISLHLPDWSKISKSYEEWERENRAKEEESAKDEEKEKDTVLTPEPERVEAGQQSRQIPVTTRVKFLRITWGDKVLALSYRAAVTSGELGISLSLPDSSTVESNQDAKSNKSESYQTSSGHGCPNGSEVPPNVGSKRYPHSGRDVKANIGRQSSEKGARNQSSAPPVHPRAEELSNLFDVPLLKSCRKSLSGDPVALLAACQAIQDVDHDFLVKCVVERAARPISSPSVAKAICKEIAENWKKVNLPATAAIPVSDSSRSKGDARAEQVIRGLRKLRQMRKEIGE